MKMELDSVDVVSRLPQVNLPDIQPGHSQVKHAVGSLCSLSNNPQVKHAMGSLCSLPKNPQVNLPDIQPGHSQVKHATVLCSEPYFAECFLQYQSYQFEYVPGFTMQTLPVLFLADFYNKLPDILRLIDPLGNIFTISVQHRKSRMYLDHGSCRIGEVYNLFSGAWITIKFLHTNTFKMFVRDRMGRQIMYPFPPKKYGLGEAHLPLSIVHEKRATFVFNDALHFYNSLVKNLTPQEASTPFLFLPAEFCDFAFPPATKTVTLVNLRGRKWNCKFEWNSPKPGYCCVTDGWAAFRGLNGLLPGASLKLGVGKDDRECVFVKVLEV